MGAVRSNFAGVQAIRQAGTASYVVRDDLQRHRAWLRRALSIFMLRVRLRFQPAEWFARTPAAANAAFDRAGQLIERLSWQAAKGATKAAIRAIRWRQVALVASAPFVLPSEWRGALVRLLADLAAIYALSLIATELFKQRETIAVLQPTPRPAWIEVDNPWAAFELAAPGYDEDDSAYDIRRHPQGGGRKDILSFGELGKTQRFMSVEIYRAGDEIARFASPAEEIRAIGSEQGRVLGLRSGMPIPSKFGAFQTFEFGVGPFGGYNCIGFVRAVESPRLQISGLSCGMNLLVDRNSISCALDRLTVISAGGDPEMAKLFAHAEQKRHFCGQRDALLHKTPKRPGDVTSSVKKLKLRGRQS